jgi:CxxC motif-containing protein (DUF1111 family)
VTRTAIAWVGIVLLSGCGEVGAPVGFAPDELRPGGGATVRARPGARLERAAANLEPGMRRTFELGDTFASSPWVLAPASTKARDGLGPLFNARSCVACHLGGGRAQWPDVPEKPVLGIVVKAGRSDPDSESGWIGDPHVGDQIQQFGASDSRRSGASGDVALASHGSPRALASHGSPRALGEGRVRVRWEPVQGAYDDGTPYVLERPIFELASQPYGPLAAGIELTGRAAPALTGLALLEAIPESRLVELSDPDDVDGDGISGRLGRVPDLERGGRAPGRFGWKASQPTVRQQIAAAFRNDIGITNPVYSAEPCTESQVGCLHATSGVTPGESFEIEPEPFDAVVFFASRLGVPEPRDTDTPGVVRGRDHFRDLGCEACHVPTHVTSSDARHAGVAAQTITPWTDLLLHDMGPGLAAPFGEYEASASEWRTPPLWGIGLAPRRARRSAFLHDGRAATLEEAVLWHGGEAAAARTRFAALDAASRQELIAFLEAL